MYTYAKIVTMYINAGKNGRVPDFVFLAHAVDVGSALHVQFVLRSFASLPFTTRIFMVPIWPFALIVLLAMWVFSKTFLISFYNLRGRLHQTWVVPRCGFQVRLMIRNLPSFSLTSINDLVIERLISSQFYPLKIKVSQFYFLNNIVS